jgi:hypothetical protein
MMQLRPLIAAKRKDKTERIIDKLDAKLCVINGAVGGPGAHYRWLMLLRCYLL